MPENAIQPSPTTFPDDTALDTAAGLLSGLTLMQAADLAWDSLSTLADGDRSAEAVRHRAVVLLAIQVKPLRDWLLVQAVEHDDLALACVRELVWLVAKAPASLQQSAAGAVAMLLLAVTGSVPAARFHADLGGQDTLALLVGQILDAGLPFDQVGSMLREAKPAVLKQLQDASQPVGAS